jgi:hypothetical protein
LHGSTGPVAGLAMPTNGPPFFKYWRVRTTVSLGLTDVRMK